MISLLECCITVVIILCIIAVGVYDPKLLREEYPIQNESEGFSTINLTGGETTADYVVDDNNGTRPPYQKPKNSKASNLNNAKINSKYYHDDINMYSEVDFDIDVPLVTRYQSPNNVTHTPSSNSVQMLNVLPTTSSTIITYPPTSVPMSS